MIHDRLHAGRLLAEKLVTIVKGKEYVVLAIPRGGVVMGAEISRILGIPLDVVMSKKITPPDYPEYAIGAVTYDGVMYYGSDWERYSSDPRFNEEIQKKKAEIIRQIEAYRGDTNYDLDNKTVILVDDGIATGSTVCAILEWLSKKNTKVILAIPIIPYTTHAILDRFGVEIVTLEIPTEFSSVSQFYRKFEQIPDQIVLNIIRKYKK